MQQIWSEDTDWDEPLKQESAERWNAFIKILPDIQTLKINRWVNYHPSSTVRFHGFCDASESAFSAALYIHVTQEELTIFSNLICAKTKVAPLKQVSLPRLELCGAVLLSKLVKFYLPNFPVESYNLFLWTDSSIVLAWLNKPPRTWKTFIANRITIILDNVGNTQWRHVKSLDSPADLATRGILPLDLKDNSLWWNGPSWLQRPE